MMIFSRNGFKESAHEVINAVSLVKNGLKSTKCILSLKFGMERSRLAYATYRKWNECENFS